MVSQQIHLFSDLTSVGCGSVAYLRLRDGSNCIYCSFLIGKALVAPIKSVMIPRLELTAATVLIRLEELLKREVDGNLDFVYHADSTTVLCYIANEQQRFHVFVVNRVQLICECSCLNHWKYIDRKENPADDASWGLNGLALIGGQHWLQCRGLLWKMESEWPQQPLKVSQVPADDPEVEWTTVASGSVMVVNQSAAAAGKLIYHFSDWHRLRTAVAVFLQVKKILRIRCKERMNVQEEVSRDNKNLTDWRKPSTTKTAKHKDTEEPCSLLPCKTW